MTLSRTNYWEPVDPVLVPEGPPAAVRYGRGCPGYEFFAPRVRQDGIPMGYCFCGHRRPGMSDNCSAWCKHCKILWVTTWGQLGWIDQSRMVARPEGVVA